MDKLQMAHDYLLKTMRETAFVDESDICFFVDTAWKYADAMQAEAEKREDKTRPDVLNMANSPQLEWQPDWSQAPENAVAYTVDQDGFCAWHLKSPILLGYGWTNTVGLLQAPSFDYQGNWKESLRKRPQ